MLYNYHKWDYHNNNHNQITETDNKPTTDHDNLKPQWVWVKKWTDSIECAECLVPNYMNYELWWK